MDGENDRKSVKMVWSRSKKIIRSMLMRKIGSLKRSPFKKERGRLKNY